MKRFLLAALIALAVSFSALWVNGQAASGEPTIRPDPRPTDLTDKDRNAPRDEPRVRPDRRPLDLSTPRQGPGGSRIDVSGLSLEQSEKLRVIRQRAAQEIQTIRDRERAEIMAVLNDQQRLEFMKIEDEERSDRPERVTTRPAPPAAETVP